MPRLTEGGNVAVELHDDGRVGQREGRELRHSGLEAMHVLLALAVLCTAGGAAPCAATQLLRAAGAPGAAATAR